GRRGYRLQCLRGDAMAAFANRPVVFEAMQVVDVAERALLAIDQAQVFHRSSSMWIRGILSSTHRRRRKSRMNRITPFLWYDREAEEAAKHYVSIFRNSRITQVARYGKAGPGPEGSVMTVAFELEGQPFLA